MEIDCAAMTTTLAATTQSYSSFDASSTKLIYFNENPSFPFLESDQVIVLPADSHGLF